MNKKNNKDKKINVNVGVKLNAEVKYYDTYEEAVRQANEFNEAQRLKLEQKEQEEKAKNN